MDDLIRRLSEIRSQYNCFDEAERRYYHALSEAIRELSGRADGDTIYRQAAIDGVKTLHDVAWKNWHEPTLSANVVLDMIGELPSAQPVLTCDGCMHVGIFDTDFPCNLCVRRAKDYYEQE